MKRQFAVLVVAMLAVAGASLATEIVDGVAAIVNDTLISTYDLRQRMALFAATISSLIICNRSI